MPPELMVAVGNRLGGAQRPPALRGDASLAAGGTTHSVKHHISTRRPSTGTLGAMVKVNDDLEIPDDELDFQFARSGGPGGQNVNKVNTRVQLRFDVLQSPSLNQWQRETLINKLRNRIDKDGRLLIDAHNHRTQLDNRHEALERFAQILAQALVVQKKRHKTRVSRAAKERRLESKRQLSAKKKDRSWKP